MEEGIGPIVNSLSRSVSMGNSIYEPHNIGLH
jgi:hypothetical protein